MRPEDQEAINADVGRRNTARKAYTREGSTAPTIANMDWQEFAAAVDEDSVFRAFDD